MADYGYISKGEKRIPIDDPSGKWSELTLLPEWDEEYCDIYTVKKYGKWIMLKALKPEYAKNEEYQKLLNQEFDVRYNLAHPNIVMVNDYEEIPGLGKAIITDDAYGYSLRRLIDEKRLTPKIVNRLQTQLLDAMEYIQENKVAHAPISPESIIFTEYNENLKLANVGYAQKDCLTIKDSQEDIKSFGRIINEVLDHLPTTLPRLRKIAKKCEEENTPYHSIADIHMAIERRNSNQLYILLCIFIAIMASILVWFSRQ